MVGAGCIENNLASVLLAYGSEQPGLDQYAIRKYADALQVIPRMLAENSGFNAN